MPHTDYESTPAVYSRQLLRLSKSIQITVCQPAIEHAYKKEIGEHGSWARLSQLSTLGLDSGTCFMIRGVQWSTGLRHEKPLIWINEGSVFPFMVQA